MLLATEQCKNVDRASGALAAASGSAQCRHGQRTPPSHQWPCDTDDGWKSMAREGNGVRGGNWISDRAARSDRLAGAWC